MTTDVGSKNGYLGEGEIMELFGKPLYVEYLLFVGTNEAQLGIGIPLAIAPGGLRDFFLAADVPFGEGNESLDRSFVAGCECDPRRIVQQEELVRLCNGFIESLPDERSRAIIRACFWKDDDALASFGLDARQMKHQVVVILAELRNLLRLLKFSSGDFY